MSPLDSLALFRRSRADSDLTALADEHMRHELPPSDRDALRKGASQIANHTIIGSLLGLGLGVFMAARLRRARGQMFEAFKAREKPVEVRFQDGRTGMYPYPARRALLRSYHPPEAICGYLYCILILRGDDRASSRHRAPPPTDYAGRLRNVPVLLGRRAVYRRGDGALDRVVCGESDADEGP